VIGDKPQLVAAVTPDLVNRGMHAGNLLREAAKVMGGGGGGRPDMAQAGGKDAGKLDDALATVPAWVTANLK
jgi:alanyl-tRNA synthetase